EALTVAHKKNIIHRDIKPQNLMRRRSDRKIILIDFGAVKEIGVLTINKKGLTSLTKAVGTPGYMPSEQSNGKPKLSSDIYAVGMVGIKALTGKDPDNLPVNQDTGNIIWQNEAQVSNRLANILDRMVHEYFPQRYQNAMEVLEELPEMTIKINSSRQGQKSRGKTSIGKTSIGKTSIGKTSIGKTSIGKPNSHGQGQTSTVKVKQPKPKLGKIRRLRSILVALVANGFLVVLTKYFWDMSTSQQYVSQENSQENSSVFSQETPLEDISTPPPTPSLSASSKTTTIPNSEGSLPRAKIKEEHTGKLSLQPYTEYTSKLPLLQPYYTGIGEQLFPLRTLATTSGPVWSITTNPDGRIVASGTTDGSIQLLHLTSGENLGELSGHDGPVFSVAISPDGRTLVSASSGGKIKIWDLYTHRLKNTLSGHLKDVWSVAISPDSSTIGSVSKDKTIKLWDLKSGLLLHTLYGHTDEVQSVAFSSDGKTLASGSNDGTIKLWNWHN
ncbi:MAG: WD40 repeat domain-containing serine/threonine-protein kinase, partial [Trichodesmium sp. St7_bin2_1]|nr:WD40 repeat domain-containing serine/threonine-protein kinase [Trichodesmium sp. St7_bin2_1]